MLTETLASGEAAAPQRLIGFIIYREAGLVPTAEQGGGVAGSQHFYYKLLNRMAGLFHTHEQVGGVIAYR